MELITANKRLNDLETSCKFLAEKYDALMTSIHDLKKQQALRIHSYNTRYTSRENLYRPVFRTNYGLSRFTPTASRIWENIPSFIY